MKKSRSKTLSLVVSIILFLDLALAPSAKATEIIVSGNGNESQNTVETSVETTVEVVQQNNAEVQNDVNVESNTGDNEADGNTGEVTIQTGDVQTDVTVENKLNNSEVDVECCADSGQDLNITENGEGSENTIDAEFENTTNIEVTQNSTIKNNIVGYANTGNNTANDNGGSVTIETGDIYVNGKIENISNSSKISAPSGGDLGLSASVSKNGSDSENVISVKLAYENNISTDFYSDIVNDIQWDLNTGGNEANGNLGDVSFLTGDIFFDFAIVNGPINLSEIDLDCCAIFDPGDDGKDGDDDNKGGDGGGGGSSNDGGGSSSDGGGGDGGTLLATAAATELLGLSNTSSDDLKKDLFWIGFFLIAFGVKLLKNELKKFNDLKLFNEVKKHKNLHFSERRI